MSSIQVVDLVAVVSRQVNKVDAEPDPEFVIGNQTGGANLMAVRQSKAKCDRRSSHRRHKAVDEYSLAIQIQNPAIAAFSFYLTTGAQEVIKLHSIARRGTSTHKPSLLFKLFRTAAFYKL